MIRYLKGVIIDSDNKSVTLDVSGVGYRIFTNIGQSGGEKSWQEKKQTEFWIHTAVRENSIDLYGYKSKEELDLFELLITVSGVGPKSALAILTFSSVSSLKKAIISGDITHLVKVSGIGKKNAEKIVIELKDKIESSGDEMISSDADVIEALKSLGYSERESRDVLKKVDGGSNAGEKVKLALKILSK